MGAAGRFEFIAAEKRKHGADLDAVARDHVFDELLLCPRGGQRRSEQARDFRQPIVSEDV
jgi:hypothetical protein